MEKDQWSAKVIEKMLAATLKEHKAARRWGIFFKLSFLFVFMIMALVALDPSTGYLPEQTKPHAAVIKLEGIIDANSMTNADILHASLEEALRQKNVKGVMIDINSPGGSPVQADDIYQDIMSFREKYPSKKIYAVISDVGASGAYYVASAAEKIYANPSSTIGSIGVIFDGFGFVDAMSKLGVERRVYTAGQNKAILDPFSPMKETDVRFIDNVLNDVHQVFIDRVKEGRGDRLKGSDEIFSGLIWTGVRAKKLGLIDDFGNIYSVARNEIKVETIIDYTKHPSLLEQLAVSSRLGIKGFIDSFFTETKSRASVQLLPTAY